MTSFYMAAHARQLEHADPVHQRARLDPALRAAHASEPHLKGVTLSACTYEYGASLLSLYIASAALTVMGVVLLNLANYSHWVAFPSVTKEIALCVTDVFLGVF